MSTLTEIEAAIARLPDAEQAQLARWLQDRCDPDAGLELRAAVAEELDTARQEIARGNVADWEQLKRPARPDSR
jgi:phosphoglycerate-specific signal transduction histidine kinase